MAGLVTFSFRLRKILISHGGGYDGMISSVTMVPDEKLGVVVLTNGMNAPTTAVTNFVLDAFLGRKEKDRSAVLLEKTKNAMPKTNELQSEKKNGLPGQNHRWNFKNMPGNISQLFTEKLK